MWYFIKCFVNIQRLKYELIFASRIRSKFKISVFSNSSIEYIFQPDGYDTYDTVDAPNTTVYSDTDTDTEDDFY